VTKTTIIAAFRHSGLWPVDRTVFTEADFAPSLNFTETAAMPSTFPPMLPVSPSSAAMTESEDDDSSYNDEEESHSEASTEDQEHDTSGTAVGDNLSPENGSFDHLLSSTTPVQVDEEGTDYLETSKPDEPPLTRSHLQSIKKYDLRVSDLCYNSPSIPKPETQLMEEKNRLQDYIYALEKERDMYKAETQALHAHCSLSQAENEKLKTELAEKKKKKRRKVNTLGRVLTRPEGEALWMEKTRVEEENEAAEALKQKTKADTIHAREVQRYRELDTKIFDQPLARYTRKDDVQDIAAAFNLPWKEGTIPEILTLIKNHMASNPELKRDDRFSALYSKRRSNKQVGSSRVASGHLEPDGEGGRGSETGVGNENSG